jgi:hypothetical protein
MGQKEEAVSIARQAKADAQSVGDESLSVNYPARLPASAMPANSFIAAEKGRQSAGRPLLHE